MPNNFIKWLNFDTFAIILKLQTQYTEDTLIEALKAHSNGAFEHLYLNYKNALLAVIKQFIDDEEIANDVLQDVFVAVWKNIEKYDSTKGRLFTWLHTLARNTTINTLRSKAYKSEQKNDSIDNLVYSLDNQNNANQDIDSIGLRKQVHLLRTDYKNVLELSDRKSTRLNSSHVSQSRMPSSA